MNIRFNFKGYTIKDLDSLNEEEKIKFDKRDFFTYFKESFLNDHPMVSLHCFKSLMEPLNLRISHLYFSISLNLYFNAVFYTDDYIEKQASSSILGDEVYRCIII